MISEGSVLNTRYSLGKKIGQGGFAQVFLTTDQLLKRRVAVKVLNSDLTEDANFLGRFEREAQSIASLDHPNILAVYDYGQADNTAYLVMPYIEGGTLHDKMRRDKQLTMQQASAYLNQAAAALDYAHRRNIVHRDIKPQNMLLRSEDDRLLLADFGIAKVLSTASAQSHTGVMGTLSYMAPEQLEGNIGFGTDIYALGCVLFQMLTGELPYTGATEQVMMGHIMRPIPSIVERSRGNLPQAIQSVIEKALAKRPEDRYHSAGELALAFHNVTRGVAANLLATDVTLAARPPDSTQYPTQQLSRPPGYPPPANPTRPANPNPPQYEATQVSMVSPNAFQPGYTPTQVHTPNQFYVPINPTQPVQTGPQPYFGAPPPPAPKKFNSGLIGGIIAIVIVALVAIIGLLLLNNKDPKPVAVTTLTAGPGTATTVSPSTTSNVTTAALTTGAATTTNLTTGPATTAAPVTTAAPTTVVATTVAVSPIDSGLKQANETYYIKGDYMAGLIAFRNLTQDYPNSASVWRDYGNALRFWNRNPDSAGIDQLEKAATLDPKDALTQLYLTDTYDDNYRYDDALQAAKKALQLDPNGWVGHAAMTLVYKNIHDDVHAKSEAEAMQKAVTNPNEPLYNVILSDYLASQYDFKLGLEANDKALAVWPNIPLLITNKAVLTLNSADARERSEDQKKQAQEKGLALLLQATKLAPNSTPILTALAAYYSIFAKDAVQADKYAQQALKLNPNDAEVHREVGLVFFDKKDYASAVNEYARCNELDKYNMNCYFESADAYLGQGQDFDKAGKTAEAVTAYKAALSRSQEAINRDPMNYQGYLYSGICQVDLKDYKTAITTLQKAVSLAPSNADNYAWLGYAYLDNGQQTEAQAAYNKGVTIDPNNQTIKYLGDALKK